MPNNMQLKNNAEPGAIEISASLPGVSIRFQMQLNVALLLLVTLVGTIVVVTAHLEAVVALLISLVANYITYYIQKMRS
jgi:hypothetical protein